MTIRYTDGTAVEAILLARTERTIRVAVSGRDDAVVLRKVANRWMSEGRGAVQVEFAWQRSHSSEAISEADCVCLHQLGKHLLQLLLTPTGEDEPESDNSHEFSISVS
jgi:hypothetical protein